MKPSRRKYIIAAGFILLLIISVMVFSIFQTEPKSDPESEKIIREIVSKQLNKDPNSLTDDDFAKITEFSFAEIRHTGNPGYRGTLIMYMAKELSDIKLLKKFINLHVLNINNIRFPEKNIPKWVKILAKLGIFDISDKYVIDLSPIKNLTLLEDFSLQDAHVKDIKPLSNLINLKRLYLNNTKISDLKPLTGLINLEELYLNGTYISNLDSIKNLTNLRILHLYSCPNITDEQVEDLQKALPNLKIIR
jgi:hypothetical protein